jgi:hypothetical protein
MEKGEKGKKEREDLKIEWKRGAVTTIIVLIRLFLKSLKALCK